MQAVDKKVITFLLVEVVEGLMFLEALRNSHRRTASAWHLVESMMVTSTLMGHMDFLLVEHLKLTFLLTEMGKEVAKFTRVTTITESDKVRLTSIMVLQAQS